MELFASLQLDSLSLTKITYITQEKKTNNQKKPKEMMRLFLFLCALFVLIGQAAAVENDRPVSWRVEPRGPSSHDLTGGSSGGSLIPVIPKDGTDFASLRQDLETAAEEGNAQAQFALGVLTMHGAFGVSKSVPKALLYYTMATLGGDPDAAMALGYRYAQGLNVEKNCESAVKLYGMAAKDVVEAHHGAIISQARWQRLAAHSTERQEVQSGMVDYHKLEGVEGSAKAPLYLGYIYLFGLMGEHQDGAKAEKYLRLAAQRGEVIAYGVLGQLYARGLHGISQNVTAARECFEIGARHEDVVSINALGTYNAQGLGGLEKNVTKALRYFKIGAANGNAESNYNLGMLYLGGVGVDQNNERAHHYLTLASQHGQALARYHLAVLYRDGRGVEKSCVQALQMLRSIAQESPRTHRMHHAWKAFHRGESAQALLGYLLTAELGIEAAESNAAYLFDQNATEEAQRTAFGLYMRAAEQGSKEAMVRAADYQYAHGDMEAARDLYAKAEQKRSARAAYSLGTMHHYTDKEMAKRYYEAAVEYDKDASVPVGLLLYHLYLYHFWTSTDGVQMTRAAWAVVEEHALALFGMGVENVALFGLAAILVVLVYIRQVAR